MNLSRPLPAFALSSMLCHLVQGAEVHTQQHHGIECPSSQASCDGKYAVEPPNNERLGERKVFIIQRFSLLGGFCNNALKRIKTYTVLFPLLCFKFEIL